MPSAETLNPAKVWFLAHGENELDVDDFVISDAISAPFSVVVTASTQDGALDLSAIVGKGAAFRFKHHGGDLVWAGLCSEASLVRTQPEGARRSAYRFTIVPALSRTKFRRNSRVFERMTTPQIVSKILGEWQIPHVLDGIKERHHVHEYRVQYNETDFVFLSRILEEAGISYFFDYGVKSGPGSAVTCVVFSDCPHATNPVGGALPYRQTGRHKTYRVDEKVVFDVVAGERMRVGSVVRRDFDMRRVPHAKLLAEAQSTGPRAEIERVFEDYRYVPGAFHAPGQGDGRTPTADDKGNFQPGEEAAKLRAARDLASLRSDRTYVEFKTTSLELSPGHVLGIGQNTNEHHPLPMLAPERRLLVIGRRIIGGTLGIEHQDVRAVYADAPYRPAQVTPKPTMAGVQSALVVGPSKQEIHTDEFGRVRVQFPWDREHAYNAESSCWVRVSQASAGSGFGLIAIPRVGQEVLVSFYEGDPDRPVVVGRVFGLTNGLPYELPKHKTRSGLRTESSGGDARSTAPRGFNELMFDDAVGKEIVFMRAERNLATLVKADEKVDVGQSRTTRVGKSDVVHLKGADARSSTLVGKQTGMLFKADGDIVLTTGGAAIELNGDDVFIDAIDASAFRSIGKLHVSAAPGAAVILRGGPNVQINCTFSEDRSPVPAMPEKAEKPKDAAPIRAPYYPAARATKPKPPLGFSEVHVQNSANDSTRSSE